MALFPQAASRLPVHKYAAVGGMIAGLAYVLLSGMSVSAIRAFLMARLVLAAWLSDRLGLKLRNVGLAAGAILLDNPVALFSLAGLQRDNYLLRVGGGELVARATSGQYFRISPVSRP